MNDSSSSRLSAALAYIPIIGWLIVFLLQRQNTLAIFHLRQSVGLFLFLLAILVGWGVIIWLLSWIPYLAVLGMALFALVIAAYLFGAAAWLMGLLNALRNRFDPLPWFGRWADRLPIR